MALSAYIASKNDLKTFIKEKLGEPIVTVEISDTQLDHAINETLEKWIEFAEGGVQYRLMSLSVTPGTKEYILDFDVYSIHKIFDATKIGLLSAVFPDRMLADFEGMAARTGQLLTIELSRQFLSSIDFIIREKVEFDYNSATRTLYLYEDPKESVNLGITYYQRTNYSDEDSLIYDQQWIKRYSVELARYQWGINLTKYAGTILPEGMLLNAEGILSEAKEVKEKLELELEETWRLPANFEHG